MSRSSSAAGGVQAEGCARGGGPSEAYAGDSMTPAAADAGLACVVVVADARDDDVDRTSPPCCRSCSKWDKVPRKVAISVLKCEKDRSATEQITKSVRPNVK